MAKATTKLRSQRIVTLEITDEEAAILRQLFNHIGGQPDGPRGAVTEIDNALRGAGIGKADYFVPADGYGATLYIEEKA